MDRTKRKQLMIADISGYPTTKGLFVDENNDVFRNVDGTLIKVGTPNGYDPEYHGELIPLAKGKNKRSKLQIT